MSQNDEVKPFHARDVATGQEAADAVAAVLKHAQEREAAARQKAPPKKQPKWLLPLGVNLSVFAGYLLIWSPPWLVLNPIEAPPSAERVELAENGMFVAISKIETFRSQNSRLPRTLEEIGVSAAGLDYAVQGATTYVLFIEVEGQTLQYNSSVQTPQEWAAQNAGTLARRIGG